MPSWTPCASQLAVLIAYGFNLLGTWLSLAGVYGRTIEGVSDAYHTILTPPNYAFTIWAVIFTWEGVACVLQCLPRFRNDPVFSPLSLAGWVLTSVAQVLWCIVFGQEWMAASMSLLVVIWAGLAVTTLGFKFRENHTLLFAGLPPKLSSVVSWALLQAPFSLHFGWASAALCVTVQVVSVAHCASFDIQITFVILAASVAAVLVTQISIFGADLTYAAAVCWALFSLRDRAATGAVCTPDGMVPPSSDVASAITNATTILAAGALPLALLRSLAGNFFSELVTSTSQHFLARWNISAAEATREREKLIHISSGSPYSAIQE